jgi:pilus assembly protein TadC
MDNVATFSSILLFIFLMFLIYKLDSISLKNRIYPFIDSNKVGKSIQRDLLFKNKFLHKLEINDSEALIDSAEFADLFAVALTSGLNPRSGLEKIINFIPKEYSLSLEKALKENSFGKPLFEALDEMTNEKSGKNLKPLMQQIYLALERGTPLAEVTRNFATDQRIKLRNLITKKAAKKEIAMLMPIVFVVLPSVLAVAMYPALTVLQELG